jgi:hypothetical protein
MLTGTVGKQNNGTDSYQPSAISHQLSAISYQIQGVGLRVAAV